ncbi:hypothetical protein [Pseudonocardia sp. 73-21]|uniref:hypothetical protein n=1 Tax=Pseudonocardia sp. 73-21 TaxID=1895809 RepID=UPI00096167FC|nr:hypothetical protein [Pseudonocardia sp. 73-21]OJY47494.1 MAG: hypothetical protein BGP03_32635 [Pseudonocardia sp. 73-21]
MSTDATSRRLEVLDLRIRLERTAVEAYVRVCNTQQRPRASGVRVLLLFLVGLVDSAEQPRVHRLAGLGDHVYRRTSDVLHGRLNALDLTDVVVEEWRTIVTDLEAVVSP